MSERLPVTPERSQETSSERHKRSQEALRHTIEQGKNAKHEHADNIESIRKTAEQEAKSAEEVSPRDETSIDLERPAFVNQELKSMAYRRTLKRTQRQLSPPARLLSKVVHQPAVEAASDFAASTVARPTGILAGGISAFLGSSIFLWISRHYGYEYNFLLFALLFIAGFFIGLLVELGLRAAARRSR